MGTFRQWAKPRMVLTVAFRPLTASFLNTWSSVTVRRFVSSCPLAGLDLQMSRTTDEPATSDYCLNDPSKYHLSIVQALSAVAGLTNCPSIVAALRLVFQSACDQTALICLICGPTRLTYVWEDSEQLKKIDDLNIPCSRTVIWRLVYLIYIL